MKFFLLLFTLLLFGGCSTTKDYGRKIGIAQKAHINLPFVPQKDFHCGPAAIGMVLAFKGKRVSQEELSSQALSPGRQGSLQADMISTIRRQGMIPYPVNNFENLLREVSAGEPVIVLQNLGLEWFPKWHYSVVAGHNLKEQEIILHSGKEAFAVMDIVPFETTWERSKKWAVVLTRPGDIPKTASESTLVKETAILESLGLLQEAKKSYTAILQRWSGSFGALIGLGNIAYAQKDFQESVKYLKAAVDLYPDSTVARHNYSLALKASKNNTALLR